MESFLLQLIYETHQVVGESFRSTFEKNRTAICANLTGEEMGPSFERVESAKYTKEKHILQVSSP